MLEGAKYKFEVWIDYKNLEYFMKVQKLNFRQAQWVLYLLRFDFTLKHILGTKMRKTDGLSRQLDWKVGVEKDNKNQVVIKNCCLCSLQKVVIDRPEIDIVKNIKKARSKDKEIVRVVEEIKKAGIKVLREKEWQIEGDLVLKEGKVYVSKDEKLRVEIIQLHNNTLIAEHREKWKMMELVTRNYWWPEVTKNVGKYVEGCDMCQRMKNKTEVLVEKLKLKLSKVLEKPWTHLMVDFIMKLLLVAEKDTILVVCNKLSKIMYFVAATEGTLAEELVRLFKDNMWKLYRLPESIVSDKGPQFAAEMTKELNTMLRIETKLSTAFYLQTDGQMEKIN